MTEKANTFSLFSLLSRQIFNSSGAFISLDELFVFVSTINSGCLQTKQLKTTKCKCLVWSADYLFAEF